MQHKAVVMSFYFEPLHWKNKSLLFKVGLSKIGHDLFLFAMKPSVHIKGCRWIQNRIQPLNRLYDIRELQSPPPHNRAHPQPPPPSLKMKTKPHPSSNLQSPMLN